MPDITIPDAAVEAVARKLALLDEGDPWPSNVELGGHPLLGTRDDEYRHGMRERATELLLAAAPHIAAQALRDADAEVGSYAYTPDDVREVGQGDYVDGITDAHHVFERLLNARADRIEADHG